MSMTDRVRKLRQQSLDAKETLSSERAELLTDFYWAFAAPGAQALRPYVPFILRLHFIPLRACERIAGNAHKQSKKCFLNGQISTQYLTNLIH